MALKINIPEEPNQYENVSPNAVPIRVPSARTVAPVLFIVTSNTADNVKANIVGPYMSPGTNCVLLNRGLPFIKEEIEDRGQLRY